jgi:uncharacterized membrane protein YheB (UPF0754 family)
MTWIQILNLLVLPIVLAGAHGYFTNWLAVKLLLKPVKPIQILGFRIQGLLPRRQAELADRISEAIAEKFLTRDDILAFIRQVDPVAAMRHLLITKWEEKIGEILDGMPFLKMFVSPEKLVGIRDRIADAFASEADSFTDHLVSSLEGKIDLKATLRRNILAFDVSQLNEIIEQIGYREFKEIAWIGGFLGVLIGVVQAIANWIIFR